MNIYLGPPKYETVVTFSQQLSLVLERLQKVGIMKLLQLNKTNFIPLDRNSQTNIVSQVKTHENIKDSTNTIAL